MKKLFLILLFLSSTSYCSDWENIHQTIESVLPQITDTKNMVPKRLMGHSDGTSYTSVVHPAKTFSEIVDLLYQANPQLPLKDSLLLSRILTDFVQYSPSKNTMLPDHPSRYCHLKTKTEYVTEYGFLFSWCECHNSLSSANRLTNLFFNLSKIFENHPADSPLSIVSFGSGEILYEAILTTELARKKYKKIIIHLIDTKYKDYETENPEQKRNKLDLELRFSELKKNLERLNPTGQYVISLWKSLNQFKTAMPGQKADIVIDIDTRNIDNKHIRQDFYQTKRSLQHPDKTITIEPQGVRFEMIRTLPLTFKINKGPI